MKKILSPLILLFTIGSSVAYAQGPIENSIANLSQIAEQLVPLLMTLAIVMFFWGIVKFIANMGDEEARKGGKQLMIWGMVAIFVMVSFWSIIGYFQESLGLTGGPINTGTAPSVRATIPN